MIHEKAHVLDVIEQAQRKAPFCEACTSPAIPVARDGAIWLECASLQEDRPFLRKLLSLDFGAAHTRRLILEDAA